MTAKTSGKNTKFLNAALAITLLMLLSLINLIAISFGKNIFVSPFPFSPPMSLFAALSLLLLASALGAKLSGKHTLGQLFSWLAITAIPLFLLAYLILPGATDANIFSSSVLLTTIAFLLINILIISNQTLPKRHILGYDILLTLFALMPLLSIFAYIFDPQAMYINYGKWVLPLPTAVGLLMAFYALVCQTNSKGAAGLLTRESHYARNFQWLLILVLLVPLSLGSTLALAVDLGYLRAGFGAAIFCLFATVLIATVLANNAIIQESWLKKFISEQRKNSQLQNHISEVLELSPNAILLIDAELKVLHANDGAAQLFGWDRQALQNSNFGTLIPAEHFSRLERLIKRFFSSTRLSLTRSRPINITIQNRLGLNVPASLTLSKLQRNNATHIVAVLRNNSDAANKIHDLEQQLKIDALTGAGSRTEFENYCLKLNRSQRKIEKSLAVLMLDIDNFKMINDTFGHPTGDRVLQTFSHTTQSCLREGDALFRIGGEEFAVVASNVDEAGAILLADRIRTIVKAKPMVAGPSNLYITCSIGVCLTDTDHIHRAIGHADKALYRAKRAGKDQVVVFE